MSRSLPRPLRFLLQGKLGWLSVLLWLVVIAPATALDLRVAVQQGKQQLTIASSTPATLVDGTGKPLGQLPAAKKFSAQATSGAVTLAGKRAWQLCIRPTQGGKVYIGGRWYRGEVKLIRTNQGFTAINQVDLEDYLASVVGKEMYASWPQEALKTQAVAARSYALYRRQRQRNPLYDLGGTTKYQVYAGIQGETPSTQTAVRATAGQVLTYRGQVIEAVFHSSSGGHTENSENVWSGATPYLRGVPDFDHNAPTYKWTVTFGAAQLRQRLPGLGNILAITPLNHTFTGRVKTVKIVGDAGSRTMTGRQLRKALGLKSTLFTVLPTLGPLASQVGAFSNSTVTLPLPARPTQIQIQGRGFGHGLGMSQWGAYALAQEGKTYQQILQHYYRGTTLSTL